MTHTVNRAGTPYPERKDKYESSFWGPIRRFESLIIKPRKYWNMWYFIKARETDGSLFTLVCKHVHFSFKAGRLDIVPFEKPRFAVYFDVEYLALNDENNVLTKDKW